MMADNINPMRNPDLKPEWDEAEERGALEDQEVHPAEEPEDDEIDED
jgi:hypothetical protein